MSDEWTAYDEVCEQAREEIDELQTRIENVLVSAVNQLKLYFTEYGKAKEFNDMMELLAQNIDEACFDLVEIYRSECPEISGTESSEKILERAYKKAGYIIDKASQVAAQHPYVSEGLIKDFYGVRHDS